MVASSHLSNEIKMLVYVCKGVCVYIYSVKTLAAISDVLDSNFCFVLTSLCDFGQVTERF